MKSKIGFIGLGDMGRPMAANLLKSDFEVFSCANRNRDAIETLKSVGLRELESPRRVAEQVDILMTMVVDQAQTEQVLRGVDGALAAMRPGSTIVVMSTLAPDYCQKLALAARERQVNLLDCPVSGGPMGAEACKLAMIAGGDLQVLEQCREPLEAMGTIFHCGGVGMGMVAKLANNGITIGVAALLVEMRRFARAHGMDVSTLMEIYKSGTADSFVVRNWDQLAPMWTHWVPQMMKDMGLCRSVSQSQDIAMPMLEAWHGVDWRNIKQDEL